MVLKIYGPRFGRFFIGCRRCDVGDFHIALYYFAVQARGDLRIASLFSFPVKSCRSKFDIVRLPREGWEAHV